MNGLFRLAVRRLGCHWQWPESRPVTVLTDSSRALHDHGMRDRDMGTRPAGCPWLRLLGSDSDVTQSVRVRRNYETPSLVTTTCRSTTMNIALCFLFLFIALAAAENLQSWLGSDTLFKGILPSSRSGHGITSCNGRQYVFGGYGTSNAGMPISCNMRLLYF